MMKIKKGLIAKVRETDPNARIVTNGENLMLFLSTKVISEKFAIESEAELDALLKHRIKVERVKNHFILYLVHDNLDGTDDLSFIIEKFH